MNPQSSIPSTAGDIQTPALRALTTRSLYHHRDTLRPFPAAASVTPFPGNTVEGKVSYVPFVIRSRALRSA